MNISTHTALTIKYGVPYWCLPLWFRQATTMNAVVGMIKREDVDLEDEIIFFDGTWLNGTWKAGTWHNGTWVNGDWLGGYWKNGIWVSGKFRGKTCLGFSKNNKPILV